MFSIVRVSEKRGTGRNGTGRRRRDDDVDSRCAHVVHQNDVQADTHTHPPTHYTNVQIYYYYYYYYYQEATNNKGRLKQPSAVRPYCSLDIVIIITQLRLCRPTDSPENENENTWFAHLCTVGGRRRLDVNW